MKYANEWITNRPICARRSWVYRRANSRRREIFARLMSLPTTDKIHQNVVNFIIFWKQFIPTFTDFFFFNKKLKVRSRPLCSFERIEKKRKKHPLAPHKKLNKSAQRFVRLSLTRRPLLDQAPPLMAGRANQQAPPFFDGRPCLYAAIIWRITVSTHTHTRAGVKWRRRIRFLKNKKKKYFFLSSRNWDANQAIWTRRSDETPSDLWRLLSKVLS